MFFGKRDKKVDMGGYSSEKCRSCKNCYKYRFFKTTTFFVAFFINLIPIRSKYESVCDECGMIEPIDTKAGRSIARNEFGHKTTKQSLWTFLKIASVVLVLAAAVITPTVLIKKAPDVQVFKDLVSEDGDYSVLDREGNILAGVTVEGGVKTLSFYDEVSVLVGEGGADGTFAKHEYYQEVVDVAGNTTLERIADEPGVLKDRYQTIIRAYHYDTSNDALGYATGIEDLETIDYTPNKVTYPYIYYVTAVDIGNYVDVLYINSGTKLQATFIPLLDGEGSNQIISVNIESIQNDRTQEQNIYYFDEDTIGLASTSGISPQSSSDDILNFIETNELAPTITTNYEYYKDTKVATSISRTWPNETGVMETQTQRLEVTEQNGYYILQAADDE